MEISLESWYVDLGASRVKKCAKITQKHLKTPALPRQTE